MNHSYIKTQKELDNLVVSIRACKVVVLDTEFTRRVTYYPVLSLVQVAIEDENNKKELFIIDAVEGFDMNGFFEIIGDEKILKILHSSKQDLQIFYQESGIRPRNIADTQIMANLANLKYNSGYSYLVDKFHGIELDKGEQNSDWERRPLSESQIKYALLDVEYLYVIYLELKTLLEEMKRIDWLGQEMEIFIESGLISESESLFKKFSFKGRGFREIEILKRLIIYREECAKANNVPRRHFLRDEHLDKMIKGSKIPNKLSSAEKEEFEKILKSDVDEEKKVNLTVGLNEIAAKKAIHKKAKRLIERKSKDFDIAVNILLNTQQLKLLVEKRKDICDVLCGWRYEILGEELKEILE